MLLVVVIKDHIVEHVHEVDFENVGTGIMGMMVCLMVKLISFRNLTFRLHTAINRADFVPW